MEYLLDNPEMSNFERKSVVKHFLTLGNVRCFGRGRRDLLQIIDVGLSDRGEGACSAIAAVSKVRYERQLDRY